MSNITRYERYDGDHLPMQPGPAGQGGVQRVLAATPTESDDVGQLLHYVKILWKNKWLLLATCIVGVLISLFSSLRTVPMYRAQVSIRIQNLQEPYGSFAMPVSGDPTLSTEIRLIASGSMRQRAEDKVQARDPKELPGVADILAPVRMKLGMDDPLKSTPWRRAVSAASGNMSVMPQGDSRILNLITMSPNPVAAADFVNTLAEEYRLKTAEDRLAAYHESGQFLKEQELELKNEVAQTQQRLEAFARQNGLIIASTQNVSEQRLTLLFQELNTAMADRIVKEARYQASTKTVDGIESLPEVIDGGPVSSYEATIADLEKQLRVALVDMQPEHPNVQRLKAQLEQTILSSQRERQNVAGRLKIDYDQAMRREQKVRAEYEDQLKYVSDQAPEMIQYNLLQSEALTKKKLYEETVSKKNEQAVAAGMRASTVSVVDPAVPADSPVTPSVPLNLAFGMAGGLGIGAAFVVLRSLLDSKIQVPGTLGPLNLRELGVIPSAKIDPQLRGIVGRAKTLAKSAKAGPGAQVPGAQNCLELIAWTQKASVTAEAFRSVMTSILFSADSTGQPNVLVVTSPTPQDGKTTVVSNLAIALAEINHRVLLIDADMRLPRMHTIFDIPNTFGLSNLLHDRKPIDQYTDEELIRKTHIPDLYLLPAGPTRMNLSRLLYSGKVDELVRRFRGTFDTILIDTAPVLSVPDARVLARVSDAVVLVLRAHRTYHQSALAAIRCFDEDGRRILGTILNDWDPRLSTYGTSYGHYGSYGSYGSTTPGPSSKDAPRNP